MILGVCRRLASGLVTLLLVSWLAFALIHAAPGDPLTSGSSEDERWFLTLTTEHQAEIRALYHLDEPLHRRYARWLQDVARGDLGLSFHDRRPVREKIGERLGTTLGINLVALVLTGLLALPAGGLAAWRSGGAWDRLSGAVVYALYAIPAFWAALLLQIVFSVKLQWLPLYGLISDGGERLGILARLVDRAAHLALPVVCLSYGGLAYLSRFVRASLLENAFGEASRSARARGVGVARLLFRHGLRQAALPMLTLAGFVFPALMSGSVIVETIFSIPGLGSLFTEAVLQRDVPVVMGLTLITSVMTLVGVVAADLGYLLADPRVRRAPG